MVVVTLPETDEPKKCITYHCCIFFFINETPGTTLCSVIYTLTYLSTCNYDDYGAHQLLIFLSGKNQIN